MRIPRLLALLALVFFISGLAGLVQEVAWTRVLGQGIGTTLQSTTAVLAGFLGGLALGAAIGERVAGRARRPLRLYAILEIAIGAYGVLAPALAALVVRSLALRGPAITGDASLTVLRLGLAVAVLMPVTIAMGITLPILVRAAMLGGAAPGRAVAVLYGMNTVGAAAGAALASFLLLPLLGTRLSFLSGGLFNLVAAAGAMVIEHRAPRGAVAAASGRSSTVAGAGVHLTAHPLLAGGAAFVSGMIGAVLQSGWTRMATLAFGSSLYSLGTTLGACILGIGVGPLLAARRLGRVGQGGPLAWRTLAWAGGLSLAILPILGRLPVPAAWVSGAIGKVGPLLVGTQFLILFVLLLPVTAMQGAAFPCLALMAGGEPHRGAGRVYAASSAGSVAGFLLAGFSLIPAFGTQRTLVFAGAAGLLLAATVASRMSAGRRRVATAALATAGLLAAIVPLPPWDPALITGGGLVYGPIYRAAAGGRPAAAMRRRGEIVFYREDGTGVVTVRRGPTGALSLQINGRTEASTGGDMGTQVLSAHLPLLLHPDPGRVLVIGLASGITLGAAALHPVRTLRVFEIAPAVAEAARRFDDANHHVLDDPRVELVLDDARSRLLVRPDLYDVISSQPSNPWVAGVSNLFTEEFYRLVRSRLRPGGLFCQWVQAYRMEPGDLTGVVRSFLEVFPDGTLWEESAGGGDYFLLGGTAPLRVDPARWDTDAAPWPDLERAGIEGPAGLLSRYVAGPRGLARLAAGARRHTDDDLYLEWRAPLSLFRESVQDVTALLDRHREPVTDLLAGGAAAAAPDLLAGLRAETARRAERVQALLALQPADLYALTDPFLAAGIEALRAGRAMEAVDRLRRASVENPESAQAVWLLGEAYAAGGLRDASLVAFEQAVAIDPRLAPAWIALGRTRLARADPEAARAAFSAAAAAAPVGRTGAVARNNLAAALIRLGDLEAAERALREAIALDPRLAAAHANLGLVHRRRGDAAEAEAHYDQALALDPLNTDARYNLALVLSGTGRATEARLQLEEILKIDPADLLARRALAAAGAVTDGTR